MTWYGSVIPGLDDDVGGSSVCGSLLLYWFVYVVYYESLKRELKTKPFVYYWVVYYES